MINIIRESIKQAAGSQRKIRTNEPGKRSGMGIETGINTCIHNRKFKFKSENIQHPSLTRFGSQTVMELGVVNQGIACF